MSPSVLRLHDRSTLRASLTTGRSRTGLAGGAATAKERVASLLRGAARIRRPPDGDRRAGEGRRGAGRVDGDEDVGRGRRGRDGDEEDGEERSGRPGAAPEATGHADLRSLTQVARMIRRWAADPFG